MVHREKHLDGIKGFLCVMIMLGHYFGIYKYATNLGSIDNSIYFFCKNNSIVSFILNESFWLFGFFIISGYLLSLSKINNLIKVVQSIVKRFLRLLLPIIGACIIIYFIYFTIGVHCNETSIFFTNDWFQNFDASSIRFADIFVDPIRTVLLGGSKFNTPFWVIRYMFVGSIYIYVLSYIKVLTSKREYIFIFLLPICLYFGYKHNVIILACMFGACCGWFKSNLSSLFKNNKVIFIFISLLLLLYSSIMNRIDGGVSYSLTFLVIFMYIEQIELFKKIFSSKYLLKLGNISFGIYSFHFPIYLSLGSFVLVMLLNNNLSGLVSLLLSWVFCIVVTLIISKIYNVILEKPSLQLTKKITDKLVLVNNI